METFYRLTDHCKNICTGIVTKIKTYVSESLVEPTKFFRSIYNHKRDELKTNNTLVILTYTIISFIMSVAKIMLKKIKHRLEKHSKKRDCIYTYHNKRYRIFFKKPKYYSSRIIEAHDLINNRNIVDRIKEYAGPLENFHHESVTPGNLGYEKIRITIMDGTDVHVKEFNKDDAIKI